MTTEQLKKGNQIQFEIDQLQGYFEQARNYDPFGMNCRASYNQYDSRSVDMFVRDAQGKAKEKLLNDIAKRISELIDELKEL